MSKLTTIIDRSSLSKLSNLRAIDFVGARTFVHKTLRAIDSVGAGLYGRSILGDLELLYAPSIGISIEGASDRIL
ncbi:hypothetical protein QUB47_22955 [Microcoleus sp. AT9_B5]